MSQEITRLDMPRYMQFKEQVGSHAILFDTSNGLYRVIRTKNNPRKLMYHKPFERIVDAKIFINDLSRGLR